MWTGPKTPSCEPLLCDKGKSRTNKIVLSDKKNLKVYFTTLDQSIQT